MKQLNIAVKSLILISLISFSIENSCFSQGMGINTVGASPDPSALLDVSSTSANPKGVLIPRISTTDRNNIASPAEGLQIFNTTTKCFEAYVYGLWQSTYCACSSAPAMPSAITGSNVFCAPQTGEVYSVTNVAGVTFNWSYSGSGITITSGAGLNAITVDFPDSATSGILTVTPSNPCGNGAPQALAITINHKPAQPGAITGADSVCKNQNGITYSVTNVPGVVYTWTYSGTGFSIAGGDNTNTISANFSSGATSGTLTVTPSTVCGNGPTQTLDITVNDVPAQPGAIAGNGFVCQNQTGVAYSVANVPGVTYSWTYSGTGLTLEGGDGTNSIIADFSAATSGTLSATPSNGCGSGAAQTLAIAVSTTGPSQPSAISGSNAVTTGQTGVTYSVTNVPGVTYYIWTYSGTGLTIVSGDSTNSITVNFSNSATPGTLTVTPVNACGNGTPQTLDIGVTFVLQPGPEGMDTNYGSVYVTNGNPDGEQLYCGGWGDAYYDFFEFDLSTTPSSAHTATAQIWLYFDGGSDIGDAQMQVEQITSAWTEAGVTRSNNPSYTYYENMVSSVPAGWKVIDVTSLYKAWKDGTTPNYGIELVPTNSNHTNGSIVSSDNVSYPDNVSYASYRPKLVITLQ